MIRQISVFCLLAVFGSSLYGGEIIPLPVKNALFEDSVDYASTVTVTNLVGSTATVMLDRELAASGKQSLRINRTNAKGRTTVTWNEHFSVKPEQLYEVSLGVHVREATYGGDLTLEVIELDPDGSDVGAHTPGWNQIPVFNRPQEFRRHKCNFVTGKKTSSLRINFILSGNPLDVHLDDLLITAGADNAYKKGLYKPIDPQPERAAALKILKNIPPRHAWVEKRNDKPTLIVNDKPIPLILYKGVSHFSSFAKAGVHLHVTMGDGSVLFRNDWGRHVASKGAGRFDFAPLEKDLLRIAAADPEAMVLVTVGVDPDKEWCEAHPDSIFRLGNGLKGVADGCHSLRGDTKLDPAKSNPAGLSEFWCQSYASKEYQDYVCEGLKALACFLKESPAGKIVVGFTVCGGQDGQFLPWINGRTLDYSPSTEKAFRAWLREEYKDDKTLQKAWNNSAATLDTATLASPSEILSKPLFSSQPGLDRRVVDSKKFSSIATARMLRRFLGALKKEFGRRIIGHTYYCDIIDAHMNRLAVDELFSGSEVDVVTTVAGYAPWRRCGAAGMSSDFCVGSALLRNKLHITELDYRTWRSEGAEVDANAGCANNTGEFMAQIRRDTGIALARGGGVWFYDMVASWYEDPALMATIAEAVKMGEWALQSRRQPAPQAAIFLDERSPFHDSSGSQHWNYFQGQTAWNASGVQFDLYLLADILRKDLPEYRLYVVLSPITINKAQVEALMKKARKSGKVLLIDGRPGIASADYLGPEDLGALLDMRIRKGDGVVRQIVMRDEAAEHPLVEKVHGIVGRGDIIYRGWELMPTTSCYYIDDESATVLGHWAANGKPALAVKTTKKGTVIYSAAEGGYTPQLLNNVARLAGIVPSSPAGNATYVGYGVAVSHRMSPLPVTINFGRKVKLFTPEGQPLESAVKWSPPTEPCETALVLYEKKAGFGGRISSLWQILLDYTGMGD